MTGDRVIHVAVEVGGLHLDRTYEYLPPDDQPVAAGMLVGVPFAGRSVRALVLDTNQTPSIPASRLKKVTRVLGTHVWATETERDLFRWAATRYGAAYADVLRHALPKRVIDVERRAAAKGWYPNGQPTGELKQHPPPDFARYGTDGATLTDAVTHGSGLYYWRPLPGEALGDRLIELASASVHAGRDVLVIVPEPKHQPADQLHAAFGDVSVDLRGTQSPRAAYQAWLKARCGHAKVVIGERGAAFTPLANLGLAVVFDEANPALKELRSPRHHAREVVLERARRARGVGIAIGTVPSAPAWRLLRERRITAITAPRDAERTARPRVIVATQSGATKTRISRDAMRALRDAITQGTYGVVLAARGGEGRAVVCGRCGELRRCSTCASSLGLDGPHLNCLGCGYTTPRNTPCRQCRQVSHAPLAAGASQIARELKRNFTVPVVALEGYAQTPPPPPAVVVLTRGSVLTTPPGPVGTVVLPEFSALLRRPTLDAAEDGLRLAFTLANWVALNPAEVNGVVVVDVDDPDHHAVRALSSWDPGYFWRAEAPLRTTVGFPPARYAIKLSADSDDRLHAHVEQLRAALNPDDQLLGPIVDNRTSRAELLIKTDDRAATLQRLAALRHEASRSGADLRLDVDPITIG